MKMNNCILHTVSTLFTTGNGDLYAIHFSASPSCSRNNTFKPFHNK